MFSVQEAIDIFLDCLKLLKYISLFLTTLQASLGRGYVLCIFLKLTLDMFIHSKYPPNLLE